MARPGASSSSAWVREMAALAALMSDADMQQSTGGIAAVPASATAAAASAASGIPTPASPSPAASRLCSELLSSLHALTRPGSNPLAPDPAIVSNLTQLASRAPAAFRLATVRDFLVAWLGGADAADTHSAAQTSAGASAGTTTTHAGKIKSPALASLAVSLLETSHRALPPSTPWPLSFARALLSDFFEGSQRVWVEQEACVPFVKSIAAGFVDWSEAEASDAAGMSAAAAPVPADAISAAAASVTHARASASSTSSTVASPARPTPALGRSSSLTAPTSSRGGFVNRYATPALASELRTMVERSFATAVRVSTAAGGRAPGSSAILPLHVLRFAGLAVGYRSIRHFVASILDTCLHNSSTNRLAKRLLLTLADAMVAALQRTPRAALQALDPLSLPSQSRVWSDSQSTNLSVETLSSWSRLSGLDTVALELQNVRLLLALGTRVGTASVQGNANYDDALLEALSRVLGAPASVPPAPAHAATSASAPAPSSAAPGAASATSSWFATAFPSPPPPGAPVPLPVVSILPAAAASGVWVAAMHAWLATDWNTQIGRGDGQQPPLPPGAHPALSSPSHFVLRLLDVLLCVQPPDGLVPAFVGLSHSVLDRSEQLSRLLFVLRRGAWINCKLTQQLVSQALSATAAPSNQGPRLPQCVDLLSLASSLLDSCLAPPAHSVLPSPLSDALSPFAPAEPRPSRDTLLSNFNSLVLWTVLMSAQTIVLMQALSAAPASYPLSAPTASSAALRCWNSNRSLFLSCALREWRFAVAALHSRVVSWARQWLGPLLCRAQPSVPSPNAAESAAVAKENPAQLLTDVLSTLLFLQSSPQQMLSTLLTTATAAPPSTPGVAPRPTPSAALGSFLSDLWPLDHSTLKKCALLMLDKLPLLGSTLVGLIGLSLGPAPVQSASSLAPLSVLLPRASTIQTLELLLRRACSLANQVGPRYAIPGEDDASSPTSLGVFLPSAAPLLQASQDGLLESILQLSQFTPPPGVPAGLPLLAQSALYWRACILLVILSAFNPHTIGRQSWEQVPTLRCLMELALSELWLSHPGAPLSSLFPPFPGDLITKQLLAHKSGMEVEAILAVENSLPGNRDAPRNKDTSLYIAHAYLMLLDPSEILRRPPEQMLMTLQKLVDEFALGDALRASVQPNFLSNLLSRQTPEVYTAWLRHLVVAHPEAATHLPAFALAELTLQAIEKLTFEPTPAVVNQVQAASGQTSEELKHKLPSGPTLSRNSSLNASLPASSPSPNGGNSIPSSSADPLCGLLHSLFALLRRALPSLTMMYAPEPDTGEGVEPLPAPLRATSSSIMEILSPSASAAAEAATSVQASFSPFLNGKRTDGAAAPPVFDHATFLQILTPLLQRLQSRSLASRRAAARMLHFWLCPHGLPSSFGGADGRATVSACCDVAEDGLHASELPPLPPATCWLRFFYTFFLHATPSPQQPHSSPWRAPPPIAPLFLASGRAILRRLCLSLNLALEIESEADVLFGYISFLHSLSTGFSPLPNGVPSRLFGLDLAMRVCDVVMSRELVAERLVAPLQLQIDQAQEREEEGTERNGRKRRRSDMHASRQASDDSMPELDLASAPSPAPLSLDAESRSSLSPVPCASSSRAVVFSGYALLVRLLDSAFGVVEWYQEDERFIRRMLAREQRKAQRFAHSVAASADPTSSDLLSTPAKTSPSLRRSRSLVDEEGLDDDEYMGVGVDEPSVSTPPAAGLPSTPVLAPSTPPSISGGGMSLGTPTLPPAGEFGSPPPPVSLDGSAMDESLQSVDEDFVSLHRRWPTCRQPILAYFPLALLHGITAFLAFPYALPAPEEVQQPRYASPALIVLQQTFDAYQHLLSLLLPSDSLHAVTLADSLPAAAPVKAGESWTLDHAGVRWPLPSELQAEAFVRRSRTLNLLLLALEACAPNQLLNCLTQFGLPLPLVQRMFVKLDAYASYQLRLNAKQSPAAAAPGSLPHSSSRTSVSLSPVMRDLLRNLPLILHCAQLYQSMLLQAQEESEPSGAQQPLPGEKLIVYLRSLQPSEAQAKEGQEESATAMQLDERPLDAEPTKLQFQAAFGVEAPVSGASFPLDFATFDSLYSSAASAPLDTLQRCVDQLPLAHCDLWSAMPLLSTALDTLEQKGDVQAKQRAIQLMQRWQEQTVEEASGAVQGSRNEGVKQESRSEEFQPGALDEQLQQNRSWLREMEIEQRCAL